MSHPLVTTLDVRTLLPRERHARIFALFDDLAPGAALELVNDHDPQPLYHQLKAQHPGRFSWNYVEQGPQIWRVRIDKESSGDCCGGCTCR
ncbi:DUF2249 domain-containing protein [Ideonella sp. BN130291]|uniref:DUF2249 domain-containing protein n=1 Tax=Ideonella sp. BN130291 TaxID=3112940 RepID=UPI002E2536E6|nr:DUF2249 domain-containing protein [Ideonella sp. BN130291]